VHNLRANILRQGLAVLTFSAIESFIRDRVSEVLCSFTNGSLRFSDLSADLQKACTISALDGVRFRLKFQDKQDKITWLMSALAPVANAGSNVSNLSGYSFGQAASNLIEDDIRDILQAFGVESPWTEMSKLTTRIGIALLDCKSEFTTIKERRHSSAHSILGNVPSSDLSNSIRSALAIAVAFDILLSNARSLINQGIGPNAGGRSKMTSKDVRLVFVEPRTRTANFEVRREQLPPPAAAMHRPTLRLFGDEAAASSYGTDYIRRNSGNLVVLGATRTPTNWSTW
jgi:hypothetical protein